MLLEGGGVAVLETLVQGVAKPGLDIQGQELYLEAPYLAT